MSRPEPTVVPVASPGRTKILEHASALFIAQGYAAVSMQQIADAAGINKATLYHHFRDKDDLYMAVLREELARINCGRIQALAAGGTLREQLGRLAAHIFVSSHSDVARLAADVHQHLTTDFRTELARSLQPAWEMLEAAFATAAATGEIAPIEPRLAANLFFSTIHGQVMLAKMPIHAPELDERLAGQIADLFLDGLRPRPRSDSKRSDRPVRLAASGDRASS